MKIIRTPHIPTSIERTDSYPIVYIENEKKIKFAQIPHKERKLPEKQLLKYPSFYASTLMEEVKTDKSAVQRAINRKGLPAVYFTF